MPFVLRGGVRISQRATKVEAGKCVMCDDDDKYGCDKTNLALAMAGVVTPSIREDQVG